jgi:hypothetical protein
MNVISFSLWGSNPKYTVGAIKNIKLASMYYPTWQCWFYCDVETVPKEVVEEISSHSKTKVIPIEASRERNDGMFWRFYAIENPEVELFVSRDCDSRITQREGMSVLEWISSGKSFHVMRDHPHHGTVILGGMWGVKAEKLRNIKTLIDNYYQTDKWKNPVCGVDQDFLRDFIWETAKDDCYENDEFFAKKPFTLPRDPKHFIGQVYDENDKEVF